MNAHVVVARPARQPRAGLSLADWGVVAAAVILDLSLILPWVSLGGFAIRPAELLGVWALVGLLALIVLASVLAGRWPHTRWLALVPLASGCLLLGVLAGVAGAVLALNPLLARLPWQEANEIAQTAARLASLARLPTDQLNRLSAAVNRFALEPEISLQAGSWLFGASAVALIVVGYRKVVESFSAESAPSPPAQTLLDTDTGSTA